jgi:hypothetical protein
MSYSITTPNYRQYTILQNAAYAMLCPETAVTILQQDGLLMGAQPPAEKARRTGREPQ